MFVWVSDLKRMFLRLSGDISAEALIWLWQSYHLQYTDTSHPPAHTVLLQTHSHSLPICSHKGRTWTSQSLLSNFLFNGPPDNLLFSSVLLVWPLAQSLPQPSTKTQDLSALSGGGSSKEKKKEEIQQQQPEHGFLRYHSNLELIPSVFSALFKLDPTQFSVRLYRQTMFVWWSLCRFWLLLSLQTWSGVVFRLRAFYPSYLLIAGSLFSPLLFWLSWQGVCFWTELLVDLSGSAVILLIFRVIPWIHSIGRLISRALNDAHCSNMQHKKTSIKEEEFNKY